MIEQIKLALARLDDAYARKTTLKWREQALIDGIMTPEIKAQLQAIKMEFEIDHEQIDELIEEWKGDVKDLILVHGETVKSEFLNAIWVKPRVSWDTQSLESLKISRPDIWEVVKHFRKVGKASVQIRKAT